MNDYPWFFSLDPNKTNHKYRTSTLHNDPFKAFCDVFTDLTILFSPDSCAPAVCFEQMWAGAHWHWAGMKNASLRIPWSSEQSHAAVLKHCRRLCVADFIGWVERALMVWLFVWGLSSQLQKRCGCFERSLCCLHNGGVSCTCTPLAANECVLSKETGSGKDKVQGKLI